MRRWARVTNWAGRPCGSCSVLIPHGAPALWIKLEHVKRELVRCAECVGEAPPELPPLEEREQPMAQRRGGDSMRGLGTFRPKTRGELKDWVNERRDLR